MQLRGWSNGSVVKSADCSCRGPIFDPQHPHQVGHDHSELELQETTLAHTETHTLTHLSNNNFLMSTADSHLTFSWAILVESNWGPLFICQHCDLPLNCMSAFSYIDFHYPVRVGSAWISESTVPASSKLFQGPSALAMFSSVLYSPPCSLSEKLYHIK